MPLTVEGPLARFFYASHSAPLVNPNETDALIRLGSLYGGWWIDPRRISPGALCLTAGVGEDVTFDLALAETFDCQIHLIDPTPRAILHWQSVSPRLPAEIQAKMTLHPVGLWSENSIQRFYVPQNPQHISHSIVNLQGTQQFFEAPCITLQTLVEQLGNRPVTLLKLDIEGAEYEVLRHMLMTELRPSVLCVEFDEVNRPLDTQWTERVEAAIEALIHNGYQLVHVEQANATFTIIPTSLSS